MLAEISDGKITFPSASYQIGQRLKPLPGARWSPVTREWTMPLSWAACQQLRGEFEADLQIGPALSEWAWAEKTGRVDPSMVLRTEVRPRADAPYLDALMQVETEYAARGLQLFEHQRADALFMVTAGSGLIGNEAGTGKSASAITTLNVHRVLGHGPLPALIICPNSMKRTWQREFAMWAPDLTTAIVSGTLQKRREAINSGASVLIINWEGIRGHSRLAPYGSINLRGCVVCDPQDGANTRKQDKCEKCERDLNLIPFRTVIADEGHKCADSKAAQTRAAWALSHGKNVQYAWALTGTPIANHPGDLWSVMHMVAPHEYPSKSKWLEHVAKLSWNMFGGMEITGLKPEHRDEFFRIFDPRFRRMPKELVLPFLPPKLRQMRYVTMHAKQKQAYDRMKKSMVALLEDDEAVIATSPLVQATRLLQFSSSYAELDDNDNVLLSEPSAKLDEMMVVLEELGDEPLVIAAESAQLIWMAAARLLAAGITHSLIIGGQLQDERQQAIDQFQAGQVRVCLFTMKAGGIGLTLTRAGTILFLQRSWSMVDNVQSESRCHRIGSEIHDKILIIDLIAEGTVEEKQLVDLAGKMERSEEIVRDRETLLRMLK